MPADEKKNNTAVQPEPEPAADDATLKVRLDSKGDATAPERKRKKRSDAGKPHGARKKAIEPSEKKIPLKYFLMGTSKAIAIRANQKRIEMYEGEAEAIEKGWNKFFELQVPDLLDNAPIMHGIMPTAEYLLRVIMTPAIPYTTKPEQPEIPDRIPPVKPEKIVKIKPQSKMPDEEITDISELRNIKLEGLDESRTLRK